MKNIILSIIIALALVLFAVLVPGNNKEGVKIKDQSNISFVEGVQIIDLTARGGYTPRRSNAQAGVPTVLRIITKGTFDCSATIRIPSMDIAQILPLTGATEIDLKSPEIGILYGSCGMGMYPFEIDFR